LPTPKFRADKCDLCRGHGASACVQECPTGAMLRVPVGEQLVKLDPALYEAVTATRVEKPAPIELIPVEKIKVH
jgi:ferredoxin